MALIFRKHLSYFTEYLILLKTPTYSFVFVNFFKSSKGLPLLLFSPYLSPKNNFFMQDFALKRGQFESLL